MKWFPGFLSIESNCIFQSHSKAIINMLGHRWVPIISTWLGVTIKGTNCHQTRNCNPWLEDMHLQFTAFLDTGMSLVIEIHFHAKTRTCPIHVVNYMAANDLTTPGATASADITCKMLVRYILSSVCLQCSLLSPLFFLQYTWMHIISLPIFLMNICNWSLYHFVHYFKEIWSF